MSKSTRATNAVEICLRILGEVKVDNDVNGLNIDTACEKVGTDKITADSIAEIVKDAIAVGLQHFRVGVEAGVAQLCDLFGKQFDAVGRVAENDGLVDLQLREKSIEAMDLLSFFDVCVVLGYTAKG
jgi:uncharacterized protein with von Willebrand factor type A (vWA) domain